MSMPYFALYPVDFLADVGHLGNTELGIYWRLLLVYYRDGRPLPCDNDRLRRIAMTFSPEEFRCLDAIVSEFFVLTTEPDGTRVWRNRRADHEINRATTIYANKVGGAEKARAARASRMTGGVVGAGAVPAITPDDAPPEPRPEPPETDINSDISPDIKSVSTGESEPESESEKDKKTSPPSASKSESDQVFDVAWDAYPRRPGRSRQATLKAWSARLKAGVSAERMLGGVKAYAAYCVARGTEPQFIKQPETFFGPDCHFDSDWTPPADHGTKSSPVRSLSGMNYNEGADEHGNLN